MNTLVKFRTMSLHEPDQTIDAHRIVFCFDLSSEQCEILLLG